MRRYLFDTNILSALIKQPASPLADRVFTLDREMFCTSIIVASELRYGAVKKGSRKLSSRVEQLLEQIDIIPLQIDVSHHYAAIRTPLESTGKPIGSNDLFIASLCLSLGLTLITANIREFTRVPGLMAENWFES